MAVTEYIVKNQSDVVNPPGAAYTIAGVVIDPGTSRNLVEDGVTLEELARDASLTAGLMAGDLVGPAQTWWTDDADNNTALVPGGVYFVAPSTTIPLTLILPPAALTVQVPLPIIVYNASSVIVTLALSGADTAVPAGSLTLTTDEHTTLWSNMDPSTNLWSYLSIKA